jgi:uncharacterized protein YndB with AHSA1/START domain
MSELAFEPARFSVKGDRVTVELSGLIDAHLEDVWGALTRPEMLVQWLAPGEIDLRPGGRVRIDFADSGSVIDSRITALEPKALLGYSWSAQGAPERPLTWRLEPIGPMVRLTLELELPRSEHVEREAAGWAAHLEMLVAALAGMPMRFPSEIFKALCEDYRGRAAQ